MVEDTRGSFGVKTQIGWGRVGVGVGERERERGTGGKL